MDARRDAVGGTDILRKRLASIAQSDVKQASSAVRTDLSADKALHCLVE